MSPDGRSERIIAECVGCGAAYAAQKWADETIKPIGARNGCRCGSTEFRVVDGSSITTLHEETPTES